MSNASKHLLSALPAHYSEPVDLFICAASFEGRCLSVAEKLNPALIGKTFICSNEGGKEDNALLIMNKEVLADKFQSSAILISLPVADPIAIADNLVTQIDNLLGTKDVKSCLIDITAFTQEALLILLQVIARKLGGTGCEVDFIYTAARGYSIGQATEEKWLTKGVNTVRSVLGYSGEMDPSKGVHLIIMMGIEIDKTMKLITQFEPTKLSFGMGRRYTSVNLGHTELSQINYNKLAIPSSEVETFQISCTSPNQTRLDLARYVERHPGYNTIIAPQNTKLSTIGAGLFAMDNPEVQLCYAPATKHNMAGYSTPDNFCYIYSRKFKKPSTVIV